MNEETERAVKLEVRLLAIEYFVAHAFAIVCHHEDDDPEELWKQIHKNLIEAAQKMTFPRFDPAQSDILASELEAALNRLAIMVAEKIRHALGKDGQ